MPVKKMTMIAMAACLISVCSWITVPSAVPFTMQTFAVFCSVLLLGGKDGTLAVALYVFLGTVGLPVFSGFRGGIGHLLGPTGGYIAGFIFTSLCYMLFEPLIKQKPGLRIAALLSGLILCYILGTIWFRAVSGLRGTEYDLISILSLCVFPYVVPDILKMLLALFIYKRVRKALPASGSEP